MREMRWGSFPNHGALFSAEKRMGDCREMSPRMRVYGRRHPEKTLAIGERNAFSE